MAKDTGRQWDGKSRGGRWGYQFFVYIIRLLGIRCAYCFLAFIVLYFIPFAPKSTKAIWLYNRQRRRLGILVSVKELYRHYYSFGQVLIDKVAIKSGMANRYRFVFENYDEFVEVLNSGQGVVMIGAHIGCWEAGAGFFGSYEKKMNIVMLDAEHSNIKEVLKDNEVQSNNYKILVLNQDIIELMLQIKIALNNGEFICFNGDRYMTEDHVAAVDFMGAKAQFPTGPFKIASKCRVPIVFYYAMREPNCTYRFIFEVPSMEKKNTQENLLQQYVCSLEHIVRKYPRQWFNFYDFWKIK